jgi:hypothetical protein
MSIDRTCTVAKRWKLQLALQLQVRLVEPHTFHGVKNSDFYDGGDATKSVRVRQRKSAKIAFYHAPESLGKTKRF